MFFAITPQVARLNDANTLLVDMYHFIQDDSALVHTELTKLAKEQCSRNPQGVEHVLRSKVGCAQELSGNAL